MTAPQRPLPQPDDVSRHYWEFAQRRELRMQRCTGCAAFRFPPQPMCHRCGSMSDEWVPVSGLGTVFSFVIVHPPVLPAFQAKVPFAVVLVELEESSDLRLVGNLLDCPLERITIGLAVEVAFEELSDTLTLPQWRPR